MALTDYRKLCPKSGRALSGAERAALIAAGGAAGRARYMRCDACGRTVEVCLDPGTGRAFLFSMHLKDAAGTTASCRAGAA
jgi:hypothetical protein